VSDTAIIQDVGKLRRVAACALARCKMVGFDTETTGLRFEQGHRIAGYSLAVDGRKLYVPVRHSRAAGVPDSHYDDYRNLDPVKVADALRPLLEAERPRKCGANLKFECRGVRREGIELGGVPVDAQMMVRIVRPNIGRVNDPARGGFGLKEIREKLLGKPPDERNRMEEWLKAHKLHKKAYHLAPIGVVAPYAGEDALNPVEIVERLLPELAVNDKWNRSRNYDPERRGFARLWTLECRLVRVLADMEDTGIPCDEGYFEDLYERLGREVAGLTAEVRGLCGAGEEFNPASGKQLAEALYGKLGIECPKRTPKGAPSTDEEALSKIKHLHPAAAKVIDMRLRQKLRTTYVRGKKGKSILENTVDGRTYGIIRADGARSGRVSGIEPNLTNIPKRASDLIRRGFRTPGPEWAFVSVDLKQIEPRLLAHFSREPSLLRAFRKGIDVYKVMAVDSLGVRFDAVTKQERDDAKTVFLALTYGLGKRRLAQRLTNNRRQAALDAGASFEDAAKIVVTEEQAGAIRARYYDRAPMVHELQRRCQSLVGAHGFMETLLGRRRYFDEDKAYVALNMLIQGSAADLFKLAMLAVHGLLKGRRSQFLVPIHDEFLFLMHREELGELVPEVVRCMTEFEDAKFLVPLECEVEVYPERWGVDGREVTLEEIAEGAYNELRREAGEGR
jgi:DNA polymerase-1